MSRSQALLAALALVAAAFFAIIALKLSPNSADGRQWWGNAAFILFIAAALSDILDGYLARKWGVVTDFGGVMDPFVDKVLVLGALRYRPHPTHFSIGEAVAAARRIGARRTVLTHLAHDVDFLRPEIELPAGVELGHDGLVLDGR